MGGGRCGNYGNKIEGVTHSQQEVGIWLVGRQEETLQYGRHGEHHNWRRK